MQEIEDKIFDMIAQDVTIQGYTGYLAADERVYHDWPPEDVELSAAKPAYITMRFLSPGPIIEAEYVQPVQFPDETVELNVWANSALLRSQVAERLMDIFWSRADDVDKWTEIWTANFRIMKIIQEMAEDLEELHPGTNQIICWRKIMRLRLGSIYKDR